MGNGPRTSWGAGQYTQMAEQLEAVSQELVQLTGVANGDDVLDLACGTGNAALLAATRGARAVGVDLEPALLQIASARSQRAGLDIEFVNADLESAPVPAGGFSVVLSAFGVMYASDHDAAAAALARACAPGGRIALAAWTPGSFMPAMGTALTPYLPPPPATPPPSLWGAPDAVTELLGRHDIQVSSTRARSLRLRFTNRRDAVEFLIRTAGHLVTQRHRLEREQRWRQLKQDLEHLIATRDEGTSPTVKLACEYLLVIASRR